MGEALWFIDAVTRETMLFAATGLLIGGIDDLAVDLCFLVYRLIYARRSSFALATLPPPRQPGRIAVFIGAWDESAVIGHMLSAALERYAFVDYRLYVGVYPNDPATIEAARAVAAGDDRVRVVVNPRNGPTTKADNLNALWRAMLADETADDIRIKAVLLHDAEDVVHPAELTVIDTLIEGRAVVQLPILPLIDERSRLVSGHYADEFSEIHTISLPVRTAIGAGMPLAGTGCAVARDMLGIVAAERGGHPFDGTSLVEDYELGLRIAELGGTSLFARVDDGSGAPVAVRAYFPATIPTATRQKARWMTGIAFAGWDRTGWSRHGTPGDYWMRARDRRAPLAILVLAIAYVAVLAWAVRAILHGIAGVPLPPDVLADWLLATTTGLLVWRLVMRVGCTASCYGWGEAWLAVPRFFVGNVVSLVAAPRALATYLRLLRGGEPVWDKTHHAFPDLSETA